MKTLCGKEEGHQERRKCATCMRHILNPGFCHYTFHFLSVRSQICVVSTAPVPPSATPFDDAFELGRFSPSVHPCFRASAHPHFPFFNTISFLEFSFFLSEQLEIMQWGQDRWAQRQGTGQWEIEMQGLKNSQDRRTRAETLARAGSKLLAERLQLGA